MSPWPIPLQTSGRLWASCCRAFYPARKLDRAVSSGFRNRAIVRTIPVMDDHADQSTSETAPCLPGGVGVPLARPVAVPGVARSATGLEADDFLLVGSSAGRALKDVLLFIGIVIGLQLVASLLLVAIFGLTPLPMEDEIAGSQDAFRRKILLPSLGFMALSSLALITLIVRWRRQSARSLGLCSDAFWINGSVGVGVAIAVGLLSIVVVVILQLLFPQLAGQMEENANHIIETFPNIGPGGFVLLSVVVGFYEEVVFRGFLMTRLRRATGSWTAGVLISSVVFVGLHATEQTTVAIIVISMLSVVFCAITIWRRSLIPAIVAHTLFNLAQFLFLHYEAGDRWV